MTTYAEFLATKQARIHAAGPIVTPDALHPMLHDWQAELVCWAARTGRAAIWADTGLGKTVMQLEWARVCSEGGAALIVAPLAVCQQTVREAARLNIDATYARIDADVTTGIYVTNYEMVEHFDPDLFAAVVLDEASILKQSDGKTRTKLIDHFRAVPFRLTCTATPAPNDPEELTNQAEFLGHMTRTHMLAAYFIHDNSGWRLKGHARGPMMRWMATWAVALRRPSDLGYIDEGYELPGLDVVPHLLPVPIEAEGQLFASDLGGVGGRAKVRRDTLDARCERAADLVAKEPDESWLLWCGLNAEAETLSALLPIAVEVKGADSPEFKAYAALWFAGQECVCRNPLFAFKLAAWRHDRPAASVGSSVESATSDLGSSATTPPDSNEHPCICGHASGPRYLVSKSSIFGMGLNFQTCARMAFVGLSDSYETYYQSIRRCYRYGQTRVVHAHVVLSELESQIATNIARKEREASAVTAALTAEMRRARKESA